jgi:oxalate decarboxylase
VENTGAGDLIFLELFATDHFMDVSLNTWIRRLPIGIVEAHLGLSESTIQQIPSVKNEVI